MWEIVNIILNCFILDFCFWHKSKFKLYFLLLYQFTTLLLFRHCDIWLFSIPWTTAHQASLSFTNSQSLLKLMSIESVMTFKHLILCRPLLTPSIFPSIQVFSNESFFRIRWPKYWSFSFSISPSNEYSGLISFRTDCFDLLAVQGTLKSLIQYHNEKTSILQRSAIFVVQLTTKYRTTVTKTQIWNDKKRSEGKQLAPLHAQ